MGTAPYVPLRGNSMETGAPLSGITEWLPAKVPGGVALALYRAGYIEHPYFDKNSLKCEWIENKWWVYETLFEAPALEGKRIRLEFDGVDYACMVYWNGEFLGEHEGMFDAFSFDVTDRFHPGETVVLRVLIKSAPDEMGQIGMTSETFTQKSRFNYKWDFSTRLVNLGIWQGVRLTGIDQGEIAELSVRGLFCDGEGQIRIKARIEGAGEYLLEAECFLDGEKQGEARTTVLEECAEAIVRIKEPQLWYPNGLGAQPLYQVRICLYQQGELLEETCRQVGICRVECVPNEKAPEGARGYLLRVNGQRMYVKGVNITPLDHIYGDVPPEQIEDVLGRAARMNCNLVRVWGGGLIETEAFYDCCDRLGLLVWQEFIQSSSGIDNIPSKKSEFLRLLAKSAEAAVKAKRNHTCLAVWSGGNELMDENRIPVTEEDANIAMLKAIVREFDPDRVFLPTSASGPSEFIASEPGKSHDVHGWWQYQGNPAHYEFYAGSDSLFHSEFGCDGMAGMESLKKILPAEELRSPQKMSENVNWRFHGDWWCTWNREREMFGECEELGRYIRASQWMQAEGLRFILETNQLRKFQNSGSIIWQLNEPWPNISCTSLLEYHGTPKMAYEWARNAFSSLYPVFSYRKLDYGPGEKIEGTLSLITDSTVDNGEAVLRAELFDLAGRCLYEKEERCMAENNRANEMGRISWRIPENYEGMLLFRLKARLGERRAENIYYFSTYSAHPYRKALQTPCPKIEGAWEREEKNGLTLHVKNVGRTAALHLHILDKADVFLLYPEADYLTLLPGEERTVRVDFRKKYRFGFDENSELPEEMETPDLYVECFGASGEMTRMSEKKETEYETKA